MVVVAITLTAMAGTSRGLAPAVMLTIASDVVVALCVAGHDFGFDLVSHINQHVVCEVNQSPAMALARCIMLYGDALYHGPWPIVTADASRDACIPSIRHHSRDGEWISSISVDRVFGVRIRLWAVVDVSMLVDWKDRCAHVSVSVGLITSQPVRVACSHVDCDGWIVHSSIGRSIQIVTYFFGIRKKDLETGGGFETDDCFRAGDLRSVFRRGRETRADHVC